jgi:TetR/AcrR family transcriptional repressor of nem operon
MGQVSDAKEKLITSALELIYARSYAGVGVQELCEHAGVKKGSFYHFFPSKRDLTLAALDHQWETLRKAVLEPAFSKQLPPLKRIERFFELFYEQQCAMKDRSGKVLGCPFGNLGLELSTQDEPIRRKVNGIFRELAGYFERALRDAVTAGKVPDQDCRATARMLVAYMEGISLLTKTSNDVQIARQLGQGIRRLVKADRAAAAGVRRRSA